MLRFASIAALAVAATVTAAPAQADELDYVGYLDGNGVYYDSINDVINLGKLACRGLRQGLSPGAVVNVVAEGGNFPVRDAALIVLSATRYMCTDQYARVTQPR